MSKLFCWNCGHSLAEVPRPISRHATCDACFEVLHCCRMCRHYLPEKRPYCDHDRAEPPVEKATANFCDYFKPMNRFNPDAAQKGGNARSELDALFGDGSPAGETEDSGLSDDSSQATGGLKEKLDDLFDD